MKFRTLAPALFLAMVTSQAHAAGFAIQEQSVKGLGAAFAGGAASAEDATTIFFNPAGMTRLDGHHASVGIHYIIPRAEWQDAGSVDATGGSVPVGSIDGGDGANDIVVPSIYAMYSYNDTIRFGLGVNAPFGLVTEYDNGWIGRYAALRSDLKTLNINPSIALRFSEHWSAGFGLNFQRLEVELTSLAYAGAVVPGGTTGHSKITGQDWSMGFNFGLLYELDEDTRAGIHYRSMVDHELNGTSELRGYTGFFAGLGLNRTVSGKAQIELPDTVSASLYHKLNPQWGIMGDITWTHWSKFSRLQITGGGSITTVPEQWENTLRYSLGTDYRWNDQLTLRAGLAYDETPIPNAQLRTPRIPGEDRFWLSVGGTYNWSEALSFDLGYAHLFVDDGDIDWTSGPHSTTTVTAGSGLDPIRLKGHFDNSVDIVSVQANFNF